VPVEITEARIERAVLALAEITGEKEFIAVGRATLGITAPPNLRSLSMSDDIDLFPSCDETIALDESRDAFGEGSRFQQVNGFYIERVGRWTLLTQPPGWEQRAERRIFGDVSVLVIGLMDLAYNKLEADREKDREFFREAFAKGLFSVAEVRAFVAEYALNDERRRTLLENLERIERSLNDAN